MTPRQQTKAINTLIQMGVLVNVTLYARSGMYAQIMTQPNKTRTVPLSIAVQYAKSMKNGGRYGNHQGTLDALPPIR